VQPDEYRRFTERLRERLEGDGRVVGLVALGSMSGEPPAADEWSDHDFFVITRPGEQERMRTDLSWLPDAGQIAFAYRETAHGVKAIYRSAHLLEFAVFDLEELSLARVNRFRTLLDRAGVDGRMRDLRERTARERPSEVRWLSGQLLSALLVATWRFRRGERLSGRKMLQSAAEHLANLLRRALPLERAGALDSLDATRRFEQAFPKLGADLDAALSHPPPEAARLLLEIALRELPARLPDFPAEAARAIQNQNENEDENENENI
jgi:hypothetical protein